MLAIAEEQSRSLGDRCRRALTNRAASGNAANRAPYGYEIVRPNEKAPGKLVPGAAQANVVRRIFQWRAEGRTHRGIVRKLNADNVPSPKGGAWGGQLRHSLEIQRTSEP